jgi:hypothetical protein
MKQDIKRIFILLMFGFLVIAFAACNGDTEETSGPPVITSVRKTANPDSTFTGSFPGEMIVIQGENLKGTRHVHFNDVEIGFNPNYVTNTSIIATIPDDIPLKGLHPAVSNEIRVETPKGEAHFAFNFYSPAPVIDLLIFTIPASAGEDLTIIGSNFYEVEKIVFRSNEGNIETTQFIVSEDFKSISLKIPQGVAKEGAVEVVGVSGRSMKEFVPKPTQVFRSVSSDMPIAGDRVIIRGEYIYDILKIILPDNIEITQFAVNSTYSELSFTMPAAVPTQGGKLQVVTSDNTFDVPGYFYPEESVMMNFDDKGWYSWGNDYGAFTIHPDAAPYFSTGKCGRIAGTPGITPWWGSGNLIVGFLEYPNTISEETSLDNIVLRFSFYTEFPLDKGFFRIALGQRFADAGFPEPQFKPYLDNNGAEVGSTPGKWMDYDLPLHLFALDSDLQSYGQIRALSHKELGLFFVNSSDDATLTLNVFFDNFRFIDKRK